MAKSCRDCAYFEDRRDIDDTAICNNNRGPFVRCEDFEPRDESINEDRLYHRFCVDCTNFEEIEGTAICAKNHTPGIACDEFVERFEKLSEIQHTKLIQCALLTRVVSNSSNTDQIPEHLIAITKKIKW